MADLHSDSDLISDGHLLAKKLPSRHSTRFHRQKRYVASLALLQDVRVSQTPCAGTERAAASRSNQATRADEVLEVIPVDTNYPSPPRLPRAPPSPIRLSNLLRNQEGSLYFLF